jgi:hypothetical protein
VQKLLLLRVVYKFKIHLVIITKQVLEQNQFLCIDSLPIFGTVARDCNDCLWDI